MVDVAINWDEIPLSALQSASRDSLSMYMNASKIIRTPAPNRLFRDWRGISTLIGLTQYEQNSMSNVNPMGDLLKMLEKKPHNLTLALFRNILGAIDRWDVIDETNEMFETDAIAYLTEKRNIDRSQELLNGISTKLIHDDQWLTVDDVSMNELQQYDLFTLFDDHDRDFVTEMIKNLKKFGLKVCIPDDILGGVNFVHDAIRQLLKERCGRLIVILSPHFVNSPQNNFASNLAQSLGIAQRKRKIIPILYKDCELPQIFQHINLLNYQRSQAYHNFWVKLRYSLQSTPDELRAHRIANQSPNSIAVTDVTQTTTTQETPSVPLNLTPQIIPRKRSDNKYQALKSVPKAPTSLPITPKSMKKFWPAQPKLRDDTSMAVLADFVSTETNSSCKEKRTKKTKWCGKLFHMLKIWESDVNLSEEQNGTRKKFVLRRMKLSN